MISRVDHVSLAVRDIDAALRFFTDLLGAVPGASGKDPGMKYYWQILSLGDLSRIELITPTGEGSFLDNFLKDKQGGVHHITLQTPDIQKAKEALEEHNIPFSGSPTTQRYGRRSSFTRSTPSACLFSSPNSMRMIGFHRPSGCLRTRNGPSRKTMTVFNSSSRTREAERQVLC